MTKNFRTACYEIDHVSNNPFPYINKKWDISLQMDLYEGWARDNQLNKKHYWDYNGILMFDCEIVRDGRRVNNVVNHTPYLPLHQNINHHKINFKSWHGKDGWNLLKIGYNQERKNALPKSCDMKEYLPLKTHDNLINEVYIEGWKRL